MKKDSFMEGSFIATASLVFVKILGMLYVIPFYAIVGMQGGALYSYAYSIYSIFLLMSSAGIPSAISKIISEYDALGFKEAKNRAFEIGKKLISVISIVMFIILFVFSKYIAKLIIGDLSGGNTVNDISFVIRCVSFAVLIIPYLSVTKGYFQGHKYIKPSSISNMIEQIVRIFVILAGSFLAYKVLDSSLTVAVGVAVSGAFFGGLIAYLYLKRKMIKYKNELDVNEVLKKDKITSKEIAKKIILYAVPFIIINIVGNIYSFTDMVLILRVLDYLGYAASDVEFITSIISTWGSKILMIVNSIAVGMTVALIPEIVSSFATKNYKSLNHNLNKAIQVVFYICLPMTVGLSILATPVWTIFYNTNPYGGSVLRVMIFNALLGNIAMITNSTLQSCNRFKAVYITNIAGLFTNLILDVPLMLLFNKIGLPPYYGSTLATSIGYVISIVLSLKLIGNKEFKLNYKDTFKSVIKMLVPLFIMIIVLFIINIILPFDVYTKIGALLTIIINTIIGGGLYFFVSYKMKIMQDVLGSKYINKILKKLTFGKLSIKED